MRRSASVAVVSMLLSVAGVFAQEATTPLDRETKSAPIGREIKVDPTRFVPAADAVYSYTMPEYQVSSADGFLKLVTPIGATENNLFFLNVEGYVNNPAGVSTPFNVICGGNAQAGTGLREAFCVVDGLEMPAEIGVENRSEFGGASMVVIAIGTSTTDWYGGIAGARYFGTVQKTQYFQFKQETTAISAPANYAGNKNNVFMDDSNGLLRIIQPVTTSASRVPLYVATGLSSTNTVLTSAFRALRSDARGAFSATVLDRDNVRLGFDVDYQGATWWAREASTAWITKDTAHLRIEGSTGNTVNQAVSGSVRSLLDVDLANGNVTIGMAAPAALSNLHVNGNVTARGAISATYQDLAEWVPATGNVAPGTVVVLDPSTSNQVMPSSRAYDTSVAGVVSLQPGILLGVEADNKAAVATTGRVRVRVDATKGAIAIGDLLVTSDKPGTAMKSTAVEVSGIQMHRPGTVIGKALEPLAGGEGEILVLLSLQ
jgi:hypothetical protein